MQTHAEIFGSSAYVQRRRKMRILLVEDDVRIAEETCEALKKRGCAVDVLNDGNAALYAPKDTDYDIILLDLGLPGIDGLTLLRRWRQSKLTTPVIIITARDGIDDRVGGLDVGADDYLVKPFDLIELEARIRAVMRRSGAGVEINNLSNGLISLDPVTHEASVRRDDNDGEERVEPVQLTAREFSLLEALLTRPGAVLSREALEDKLYGYGDEVESNAVEFIIYNLRKKLGAKAIKNVRGVGWKVAKEG